MLSGEFASLNELLHFLRKTPPEHFARVAFETDGETVDNVVLENVPLFRKAEKAQRPRVVVRKRKS